MTTKRAILLGFGNVGQRCVELMLRGVTPSISIVGVSDSQGGIYNSNGLDLPALLEHKKTASVTTFKSHDASSVATTTSEELSQLSQRSEGLDLVIDVSPVDLKTGGIALPILQDAVKKGISCVLANKAPLVLDYLNLTTQAALTQCKILFSATVCGGLPVINVGQRDLRGAKFYRISGIFNSTSNYVLSELDKGKTVAEAIAEAQTIGIAEADPSLDIEGFDTANKLVIITNAVMGHACTLKDVELRGIQDITLEKIQEAKQNNQVIRLVASSTVDPTNSALVAMSVKPMCVDTDSFFGQCNDTSMCVRFETDIFEEIEMKTKEKGVYPTAAAVLRDCFDVCGDPL